MSDRLSIAGRSFSSRLFVGTGKFTSPEVMRLAIEASGTEMVTVALRRVDLESREANLVDFIDRDRIQLLPNTSGAENATEAVRLARLARAAGLSEWVKLEVTPDPKWLLPDPVETLKAAEILVGEGFVVLPYIGADPVLARRLQDVGVATVMPLGSPIGSNRGLQTRDSIRIIIEQAEVPVVVDAGLGAPSHAAEAMELGADAVLVNTAIAVEASAAFAMPKSMMRGIGRPSTSETRMFEGFRSRCTTPFACACCTARHTSPKRSIRASTSSSWRSAKVVIAVPGTSSMAKYATPSSVVPASKMRAMFGWSMTASACRSASKRARAEALLRPPCTTLSATSRRTGSDCSAR
jgi:thiazole synthase